MGVHRNSLWSKKNKLLGKAYTPARIIGFEWSQLLFSNTEPKPMTAEQNILHEKQTRVEEIGLHTRG